MMDSKESEVAIINGSRVNVGNADLAMSLSDGFDPRDKNGPSVFGVGNFLGYAAQEMDVDSPDKSYKAFDEVVARLRQEIINLMQKYPDHSSIIPVINKDGKTFSITVTDRDGRKIEEQFELDKRAQDIAGVKNDVNQIKEDVYDMAIARAQYLDNNDVRRGFWQNAVDSIVDSWQRVADSLKTYGRRGRPGGKLKRMKRDLSIHRRTTAASVDDRLGNGNLRKLHSGFRNNKIYPINGGNKYNSNEESRFISAINSYSVGERNTHSNEQRQPASSLQMRAASMLHNKVSTVVPGSATITNRASTSPKSPSVDHASARKQHTQQRNL